MAGLSFSQTAKEVGVRLAPNRLSRRAQCAVVGSRIYRVESEGGKLSSLLSRHMFSCLVCQAESSRQRKILRGLSSMRHIAETCPNPVVVDNLSISSWKEAPRSHSRHRAALVSTVSMVAVGAIGIVVASRRLRAPQTG